MQLSQVPVQIVKAWATAGSKTNPIPVPSQVGITPGAASWTDGFPLLCDTPLNEGGIWPSMQDTNGGLYQMSAIDLWMCAGGGFPYNSAFSSAIGGYPKGARVLMASGNGYWVSTVDNNVTDPDTGGAGWASDDSNAITTLTGDVTATGPGSAVATLAASGVTAGSYLAANITVDAKGRVTAAAAGKAPFNIVAMWNGASGTLVDNGQGGSGYQSGAINWGKTIVGTYYIIASTTGWPGGSNTGQQASWTVNAAPIDGSTFSYGVNSSSMSEARGYIIPSITCFAVQ